MLDAGLFFVLSFLFISFLLVEVRILLRIRRFVRIRLDFFFVFFSLNTEELNLANVIEFLLTHLLPLEVLIIETESLNLAFLFLCKLNLNCFVPVVFGSTTSVVTQGFVTASSWLSLAMCNDGSGVSSIQSQN